MEKKTVVFVVGSLVLLAGAFAAGRYSNQQGEIEEIEKIKTVTVTDVQTVEVVKIEYVERVVEKKVYVNRVQVDTTKETTVTEKPDGTVVTVVVEKDKSKIEEASSMETVKTTEGKETKTSDTKSVSVTASDEEREKTTESLAQWRASINVQGGAALGVAIVPVLSLGVAVETRILGPFWAGLAVSGDTAVSSAGLVPPYTIKAGLVMGMEF